MVYTEHRDAGSFLATARAALERHLNVNMTYLSAKLASPDSGRAELEHFFLIMLDFV